MTSPKIAGMTIRVSSGDDIMPPRATYLQRVNAHIAWLAEILADGRSYIFGTEPCAADLSADHHREHHPGVVSASIHPALGSQVGGGEAV